MKSSRTYCGLVGPELADRDLLLYGWVQRVRELGGVRFLLLRDREGVIQVVADQSSNPVIFAALGNLGLEDVVQVEGRIRKRPTEMINPTMKTGEVELVAEKITLLNRAQVTPFVVEEEVRASEELRLAYRYLDLRRPSMIRNLRLRHEAGQSVRRFLSEEGFLEVETPILTRSTPEGARDFLVPSRMRRGDFYALPQSPQLFKQLLMVAGADRYFQLARCFRDEDLRADRQPEFTQIDMEASFIDEETLYDICERMTVKLFEIIGITLPTPFPRLTWMEAMNTYGSDKPDLRNPLRLQEISNIFKNTGFRVFAGILASGGILTALHIPGTTFSRKEISGLETLVKERGLGGLAWIRWGEEIASSVKKFLSEEEIEGLQATLEPEGDATTFILAGQRESVLPAAGLLRETLGNKLFPPEPGTFTPLWVTDFPLVEWNEEEDRWDPLHHPFTAPRAEDIPLMESNPREVRTRAYDMVINGYEVGGGSIRIHEKALQEKVFSLIGIAPEEAREKFGFLLDAFAYGAPPHGGIAFGFDRLVMLLAGAHSIRDVIPFPKTTAALCPLTHAPSGVDEAQLDELGISLRKES